MWRGRLSSQQHVRAVCHHEESSCSLIYLITPLHGSLSLLLLRCQMFLSFSTHSSPPPPANDSLYLMASTRHANFPNIRTLTHTPCTHLLLWLALYALQIWVRRPASFEEAGNGGVGVGVGCSYHMTAAPRIKRQRQPPDGTLKLPSQLSKINHTKRRRRRRGGEGRGGWGLCWKYAPSAHTVPAVEWVRHAVPANVSTSTSWPFPCQISQQLTDSFCPSSERADICRAGGAP